MRHRRRVPAMRPHAGRQAGFSLSELLAAMAIVAVLAAVALPTYRQHSQKLIHLDGQSKLLEVMAAQQSFFSRRLRYTRRLSEDLGFIGDDEGVPSDRGHYRVRAEACGEEPLQRCILLHAVPARPDDAYATVLTLDSRGGRAPPAVWE